MKNDQEECRAEFEDYRQVGFEPVLTQDGSLSLIPMGEKEGMHSSAGALSESFYIYFEALELFFTQDSLGASFAVESVGLGMGYNEVLAAFSMLSKTRSGANAGVEINSYESETSLQDLFLKRLKIPQEYPFYWEQFKKYEGFDQNKISELLLEKMTFRGALSLDLLKYIGKKQKIILFDAYSNKTTASLWTEEFLDGYLALCEKGSIFTTYAATGSLNRVLKKNDFKNFKKAGFLKKRESTLALKS